MKILNKDYIFGFLVMYIVMIFTKNLNILNNWGLTLVVQLILGFIVLIFASVPYIFIKNYLSKNK